MTLDEIEGAQRLQQKRITQSRRLRGVPCYRLAEFLPRRLKQAQAHARPYLRSTSSSAIARISPRRHAARRSSASCAHSRSSAGSISSRLPRISSTSCSRSVGGSARALGKGLGGFVHGITSGLRCHLLTSPTLRTADALCSTRDLLDLRAKAGDWRASEQFALILFLARIEFGFLERVTPLRKVGITRSFAAVEQARDGQYLDARKFGAGRW